MRLLFTCRPAYGHFHPLVPLARAAAAAGHQVAFASGHPFTGSIRSAGFTAYSAGLSVNQWWAELTLRFGEFDSIPGVEHRAWAFRHLLTDMELTARLPDLIALIERWRPDVVVHEIAEFAGPLAAEMNRVPYATFGYGPLLDPALAEIASEAVATHWSAAGLDPEHGRMFRSIYFDPWPTSLQVPAIENVPCVCKIRPDSADLFQAVADLPEREGKRPTVYFTLGTFFNREVTLFTAVLNALADEPVTVIATLGPGVDPDSVACAARNVHLFSYVPQSQVLSRADIVVCHGGAGSLVGALSFGVPILVLPRGADHFYNSDQLVRVGAGRRLLPSEVTVDGIINEVRLLLRDKSYRATAMRIADEIASMPAPDTAVDALQELTGVRAT